MPRRDDAEQEDRVSFLQKFLRLEAGVQVMRALKIHIARRATFDDARAEELGQFNELFDDAGVASGLFGDDDRVFCIGK